MSGPGFVPRRCLGKCCASFSNQPCNAIQSLNRTAYVSKGYLPDDYPLRRRRCCCRQARRCACPEKPRQLFRLPIPQLPLNKTFCPAALTSVTPCSRNGYCQASAADEYLFSGPISDARGAVVRGPCRLTRVHHVAAALMRLSRFEKHRTTTAVFSIYIILRVERVTNDGSNVPEQAPAQNILRVTTTAGNAGTGLSWASPATLQNALNTAATNSAAGQTTELWLQYGTYGAEAWARRPSVSLREHIFLADLWATRRRATSAIRIRQQTTPPLRAQSRIRNIHRLLSSSHRTKAARRSCSTVLPSKTAEQRAEEVFASRMERRKQLMW